MVFLRRLDSDRCRSPEGFRTNNKSLRGCLTRCELTGTLIAVRVLLPVTPFSGGVRSYLPWSYVRCLFRVQGEHQVPCRTLPADCHDTTDLVSDSIGAGHVDRCQPSFYHARKSKYTRAVE